MLAAAVAAVAKHVPIVIQRHLASSNFILPSSKTLSNVIRHPKRHPQFIYTTTTTTSSSVIQTLIQRNQKRHPSPKKSSSCVQIVIQRHPKRHQTSSKASSNVIQNVIRHPTVIQNVIRHLSSM